MQTLRDLPEHNNLDAQIQGLLDALDFGLSVGVTTHVDQGSFHFAESYFGNTGTPLDGLASFDEYRAFDSVRALHAAGALPARIQINYLHNDMTGDTPKLQARLNDTVPFLGDQWLSNGGIGEFTGGNPFAFINSEPWLNGTRLAALNGWRNENHSLARHRLHGHPRFLGPGEQRAEDLRHPADAGESRPSARGEPGRHHQAALGARPRAVHSRSTTSISRRSWGSASACSAAGAG